MYDREKLNAMTFMETLNFPIVLFISPILNQTVITSYVSLFYLNFSHNKIECLVSYYRSAISSAVYWLNVHTFVLKKVFATRSCKWAGYYVKFEMR